MGPKDVILRDIVSLMRSPNKDDIELVTKAHDFSREAHKDQKRIGGEAYFTHLLGTSYNLASLGMSSQTIAAGFLHGFINNFTITNFSIPNITGAQIQIGVNGSISGTILYSKDNILNFLLLWYSTKIFKKERVIGRVIKCGNQCIYFV